MLQFPSAAEAEAEVSQRVRSLDGLQIALRTQPHSFVSRFLDCQVRSRYLHYLCCENKSPLLPCQGFTCLLSLLAGLDWDSAQSAIHTAALGCVKAIMNNSTGRAHVLAHVTGVNTISQVHSGIM